MGDDEFDEYDEAVHQREQLADADALVEGLRAGGVTYLAWYRLVVEFRREMRKSYGLDDVK
jgi:hypothetical protein